MAINHAIAIRTKTFRIDISSGSILEWRIASTFLCWPRFRRAKIKIHPANVHDCEIPGEIFFSKQSGPGLLRDVSDYDLRVRNLQVAERQLLHVTDVDRNNAGCC